MGGSKIRGTILGVPMIRIIVYFGSILGSPYLGKLPCRADGLDLSKVSC